MARKLGRPKAGDEVLSRDRILRAALDLVDAHGVEALSMRRLASLLGVDPMAIYHHVAGKQALLGGITELVFRDLQLPSAGVLPWREQVRAFAQAYHALVSAHPNLVFYLVTDARAAASAALNANEVLYATLRTAGLSPRMIVRAADVIVDYVNGFALGAQSGRLGQPGEREDLVRELGAQSAASFPATREVFSSLSDEDLRSDMLAGLDFILAGIALHAVEAKAT